MKSPTIQIPGIIAAVLAVATTVVYALADAKENSPIIIGLLIVCAALELVCAFAAKLPFLEYAPFVAALAAASVFVDRAFDEGYDILSKMNVEGLSTSYIVSAVLLGVTVIAAAVATVVRPASAGEPAKE
ncbi:MULTISPECIES: hypothetical protein [Bifidobacterium]|uniref:hypothetical protein n=1 Tax=Bifidobacterium TaxID=1678 RepID=UPI0025BDAB46|nr:hypothetical protein [Bifidobacterium sp. UBA4282]